MNVFDTQSPGKDNHTQLADKPAGGLPQAVQKPAVPIPSPDVPSLPQKELATGDLIQSQFIPVQKKKKKATAM